MTRRAAPVHPRKRPRADVAPPTAAETIRVLRPDQRVVLRVDLTKFHAEARGVKRRKGAGGTVVCEVRMSVTETRSMGGGFFVFGRGRCEDIAVPGLIMLGVPDVGDALPICALGVDPADLDNPQPIGTGGVMEGWWIGGMGDVRGVEIR